MFVLPQIRERARRLEISRPLVIFRSSSVRSVSRGRGLLTVLRSSGRIGHAALLEDRRHNVPR